MPPASRGWHHLRRPLPLVRPTTGRQISIQKPRDKRSFPDRAKERDRINVYNKSKAARDSKVESNSSAKSEPSKHDRPGLWQRLMPTFLRSHPALRSWVFGFAVTLPIATFLFTHSPLTWYTVSGPSMRPTLNPDCESDNDALYNPTRVIVSKWSPNARQEMARSSSRTGDMYTGRYRRGDIIVYWTPHDPEKIGVKRVVAVSGDSVQPLKGYNGQDDPEPVIVPFNHLWIEGDVNDRRKSVDSNYFGPISEALVKGRVTALWSPWWNVFGVRRVDGGKNGWPARNQGRVMEGAVHEASVNPDVLSQKKSFERGQKAEAMLQYLQERPDEFLRKWEQETDSGLKFRKEMKKLSIAAYDVARGHEDQETRARAQQLLLEIQRIVGSKALNSVATSADVAQGKVKRKRWEPPKPEDASEGEDCFAELMALENEGAKDTKPASAALKKVLEQKRQIAAAVDKEYEELDKAKLQRSGFAE
ncbi:hypothetical protein H2198_001017 [Neophaeococcomyces mojaviensis]|uniref:Uncharacterized protein n=1 Tax=Neophaeococcomyces mojaviensis TaxID=3383035 RepID=A0ACC3AID1_9EURO|nr:hypothetical protein H2198_001017 [Knufia sp. JES_112]